MAIGKLLEDVMKFMYLLLAGGIAVCLGYFWFLGSKIEDRKAQSITNRYRDCIEKGKDSFTCQQEELGLRLLVTCR